MCSVHAADATASRVSALPSEMLAAVVSMLFGAVIGLATAEVSNGLAG
jgi:hypothetical protein